MYILYLAYRNKTVKRKKNLSSNFELQDVSEFREASHESLLLTGTPSVRKLKISNGVVLVIPVTE